MYVILRHTSAISRHCHIRKPPISLRYNRTSFVDSVAQTARLLANQTHWSPLPPGHVSGRCLWRAEDSCWCHRLLCSRLRCWRRWRNSSWRTAPQMARFDIVSQLFANASSHLGPPKTQSQRVLYAYWLHVFEWSNTRIAWGKTICKSIHSIKGVATVQKVRGQKFSARAGARFSRPPANSLSV